MNNVQMALINARNLIEDESRWIQGRQARDVRGKETSAFSPTATRFCAEGALLHACGPSKLIQDCWDLLTQAAEKQHFHMVTILNDRGSHQMVLKMYDDAIAFASDMSHKGSRKEEKDESLRASEKGA